MRSNTVVEFPNPAGAAKRRARPVDSAPVVASSSAPVLIVEPDPLLGEMLQAALQLHRGDLIAVRADHPREALELAFETEFRLVVSETELPTLDDGRRFFERIRELLPLTPILALTSGSQAVLSALVDLEVAVVTKPPNMDHLLRRVDQLLERRGDSQVRGISLEGLLQVLKAERKTCRISVQVRGGEGRLGLLDGRLVHAETASQRGIAALFEALSWQEPLLRIQLGETLERTIDADLDSLLLRFCIEADHLRRDTEDGREHA